jgi:hypothetical protein
MPLQAQADQDLSFLIARSLPIAKVDQDLAFTIVAGHLPTAKVDQDLTFIVAQRLSPALIVTYADQDLSFPVIQRPVGLRQIIGKFQDPSGKPIANGVLRLRLNVDGAYFLTGRRKQVVAGRTVIIPLDDAGNIQPNTYVWANGNLNPGGTVYFAEVETAQGQRCWRSEFSIPSGIGAYSVTA